MTNLHAAASAALALLLLLLPPSAEGGEPAKRSPGTITLSDGTVLTGPIRTTSGKPLRLFEEETGSRLDLEITEIFRIAVHVVHEEQFEKWRWVEDGSREKVPTGESYPKRDYVTEVTLRNGQVHRGDIVAVIYVYREGSTKPKKVYLKKKEQGEVGETLEDLVYVESIQFEGPPPEAGGGKAGISLTVEPPSSLVAAYALPRNRNRSVEADLGPEPGAARFTGLLPGVYDLAVITPEAIFVSLAVGEKGGAPLSSPDLREVRDRVAEIADFFEEREVLEAVREGKLLRVLVVKTREGPTSMGGQRTFRRWEIWSMHRGGDRWLVDNRSFIWREHAEHLPPPREAIMTEELGGVRVESGVAVVRFAVPGERER